MAKIGANRHLPFLYRPSLAPCPSFGFGCLQLRWLAARQTWQLVVQCCSILFNVVQAQLVCHHYRKGKSHGAADPPHEGVSSELQIKIMW